MIKVAVPVAGVVLTALGWFLIWIGKEAGKKIGQAAQARRQNTLDPDLYHDMVGLVHDLLTPSSDPDGFVMMPEHLRKHAEDLLERDRAHRQRATH